MQLQQALARPPFFYICFDPEHFGRAGNSKKEPKDLLDLPSALKQVSVSYCSSITDRHEDFPNI